MGNRAVITWSQHMSSVGIYLHWQGGRDSIEGFLTYCDLKEYREDYGVALLAGVITNFMGNGMSCCVDTCHNLNCNNWDNGVYFVKDWRIVGRAFHKGSEQLNCDLRKCVEEINARMPKKMRLPPEEWSRFDEVKREIEAARKNCPILEMEGEL